MLRLSVCVRLARLLLLSHGICSCGCDVHTRTLVIDTIFAPVYSFFSVAAANPHLVMQRQEDRKKQMDNEKTALKRKLRKTEQEAVAKGKAPYYPKKGITASSVALHPRSPP